MSIAAAHEAEGAEIIGPCSESIYKVKDNYRKIIYIKHKQHDIITRIREDIMSHAETGNAKVYINFDIR